MIESLVKEVVFDRIKVNQVAGTSDTITSDAVDTAGCEGVCFLVTLGAITSTGTATCKLQQSSDNDADGYSDIEGSSKANSGDSATTKQIVIEIKNPQKRYLKLLVTRAVANVVVDSITALKFGNKKLPITDDASVDGTLLLVGPAEGTA